MCKGMAGIRLADNVLLEPIHSGRRYEMYFTLVSDELAMMFWFQRGNPKCPKQWRAVPIRLVNDKWVPGFINDAPTLELVYKYATNDKRTGLVQFNTLDDYVDNTLKVWGGE